MDRYGPTACLFVVLGGHLGCGAEVTVGGYDNDAAPGGSRGFTHH